MKRSLKKNFILYFIKQLMSIVFPLITFTYAARVLGVKGIGAINYAKSIVMYFTLISGFGISNYAIREGARIRDDQNLIDRFATEMFIINICSTFVATVGVLIVVNLPSLSAYKTLLCVFSLMVPFTLIGVEWVYSIYEDYLYITIRAILVQAISLFLLIVMVKNEYDLVKYALITVLATVGSNAFNFVHSRKYVHFFGNRNCRYNIKKHLMAIATVFLTTLASQIYLNMDVTMVGYMAGDYSSGLYSASNKLVVTVNTLVSSLRVVLLPRLSYYLRNENTEKEYEELNAKSLRILLCACVPLMLGIFCLSNDAIMLFCGAEYLPASTTLRILVFGMIFSTLNGFIVYQIFMPQKKERTALYGTLIGAVVNMVSNTILISIWKENGAAVGTVLAEFSVFAFCAVMSRNSVNLKFIIKTIVKYLLAGVSIIVCCAMSGFLLTNTIIRVIASVILSAFSYTAILSVMKDEVYTGIIRPQLHSILSRLLFSHR